MLLSTTDHLDGKTIQKYLGVVCGTDIYLVGGMFGGGLAKQENLYSQALSNAISKISQKAANCGANAIIGISTNTTSPGGLNNIIVVVTGTAVVVADSGLSDHPPVQNTVPSAIAVFTAPAEYDAPDEIPTEEAAPQKISAEEASAEVDSVPESFVQQIFQTSTEDLQLIWEDQQDLYAEADEAELKVIAEVLASRQ